MSKQNQQNNLTMAKLSVLMFLIPYYFSAEGKLDWVIYREIAHFGQELALFCEVENCCSEPAGWNKHFNSIKSTAIFLNVNNIKYNRTAKYDGRLGDSGFFLFIRNFSQDDLQLQYSCSYDLDTSIPKSLVGSEVFQDQTTTIQSMTQTIKDTQNEILKTALMFGSALLFLVGISVTFFVVRYVLKYRAIESRNRLRRQGSASSTVEYNRRRHFRNDSGSSIGVLQMGTPFRNSDASSRGGSSSVLAKWIPLSNDDNFTNGDECLNRKQFSYQLSYGRSNIETSV